MCFHIPLNEVGTASVSTWQCLLSLLPPKRSHCLRPACPVPTHQSTPRSHRPSWSGIERIGPGFSLPS